MADLLDPYPKDSEKPKLGGSIFLNNTSYSGADIKVVVTMYDAGEASQGHIDQHELEARNATAQQDRLRSEISRIEKELQSVHRGTQEEQNLRRLLSRNRKRLSVIQEVPAAMMNNAGELRKNAANVSTKVLAEIQTLSLSVHRDKQPVYACGSVYPKGWTRGPRAIAGSLIFTVFHEHVLYQFLEAHASDFDGEAYTSALMDQLPPVDIVAVFANEYGHLSRMAIYGVEFQNEGQTMSIEDILTEQVVNFVGRDFDPMRSVAQRKIDQNNVMTTYLQPTKASELLLEEDYKSLKDNISPFERFSRRRNPFL